MFVANRFRWGVGLASFCLMAVFSPFARGQATRGPRDFLDRDQYGNRSPYGEHILGSETAWRERYWENFYGGATRKLQAWSYEREYRIVLTSELVDFSANKDIRKAKYNFNDLDGIIFGIMTPMDKKLQIAKTIEEKCRRTGREDFKFYQAYYSRELGRIEHHQMTMLKFA